MRRVTSGQSQAALIYLARSTVFHAPNVYNVLFLLLEKQYCAICVYERMPRHDRQTTGQAEKSSFERLEH